MGHQIRDKLLALQERYAKEKTEWESRFAKAQSESIHYQELATKAEGKLQRRNAQYVEETEDAKNRISKEKDVDTAETDDPNSKVELMNKKDTSDLDFEKKYAELNKELRELRISPSIQLER